MCGVRDYQQTQRQLLAPFLNKNPLEISPDLKREIVLSICFLLSHRGSIKLWLFCSQIKKAIFFILWICIYMTIALRYGSFILILLNLSLTSRIEDAKLYWPNPGACSSNCWSYRQHLSKIWRLSTRSKGTSVHSAVFWGGSQPVVTELVRKQTFSQIVVVHTFNPSA